MNITIQIELQNVIYSTRNNFNKDYKIIMELYFFEKLNFLKINLTKSKMEKKKIQRNIDKLKQKMVKNQNKFDLRLLIYLKHLKIKVKKIKLNIDIGLEDAATTAICVGGASTMIAIILNNIIQKDDTSFWKVNPIYQNRNLLNVDLDCIFSLKMIHIIYTIYVLKKEGDKQNGRTSNRRAYAHSNE